MSFNRFLTEELNKYTNSFKSILLLGPRQTGKTTLIEDFLSKLKIKTLSYKLQQFKTFQEITKNPDTMSNHVELALETGPLILFVDEVQKAPFLMDEFQYLIDKHKGRLSVILSGSSARKLRRQNVNLLPGRVILKNLHSLILPEIMDIKVQRLVPIKVKNKKDSLIKISLEELLIYGSLPGVLSEKEHRNEILNSYVQTYLKEEIREESLLRDTGSFSNFLELAALESNSMPNYSNLSKETGVKLSTIKNYFEILEDTLITYSIPPFKKASRKQILSTPKYIFFDLGIRNATCSIPFKTSILKELGGKLFEQFIILELIKRIKYAHPTWKYYFWRTNHGIEVDFIIQTDDEIIPIEIKYTDTPQPKHIKHLQIFLEEYKHLKVKRGFLVGNFSTPQKLTQNIYAIPWYEV